MGFEKFRGTCPGRDPLMDSFRKLFSLRTMRTHPELVPLVFITAAAATGMVSSVIYHLCYNLDARRLSEMGIGGSRETTEADYDQSKMGANSRIG
ncbi:uncharacterized protein [Centruroides vittatus]|uniref:uncharacterized protein isoform X2 n=1 Tax=Centruroides vittatus TaxID=120091 RepID=UPI00350F1A5F